MQARISGTVFKVSRNHFPSKISRNMLFQAKQGSQNRFCSNKCFQEEVSTTRCPSKVPSKLVPKQYFQEEVPKQGSQPQVPRNRCPHKVPKNRFTSKVPRKRFPSNRFPGTGSQTSFPITGSRVRFPEKVPRQCFQEKVPKQGSQEQSLKQGCRKRFSSKVPRKRFARKGSQLLLEILLGNQLFLGTLAWEPVPASFVPAWNLAPKRFLGPCLGTVFGNRTCKRFLRA